MKSIYTVVEGHSFVTEHLCKMTKSAAKSMFKKASISDSVVEEAWDLANPKKKKVNETDEKTSKEEEKK